jgi:hypothetical protein
MTDAERQARYRAARKAGAAVIHTRRPADHRSRARRWHDTIAVLLSLQAEYAAWLEALPANLQDTPSPRRCRRSVILILTNFRRSNRRVALGGIEQRDGPTGMGHDDARGSLPAPDGD